MATTCPHCGLKNPSASERCDCGHQFSASAEPRLCANCGREFGALERGLRRDVHQVCAECATRLDVEARSTSRRAAQPLGRVALIGVLLAGAAAVAGYGFLRTKPSRDHFTFPGYEDVVIGAPVPKDIESTCRRNDPDTCDSPRHAEVDPLIDRRRDVGVTEMIVASVPEATVSILVARWGQPADRRSVGTNGSYVATWCTSDREEQAELEVNYSAGGKFVNASGWTLMRDQIRVGMFDCHSVEATGGKRPPSAHNASADAADALIGKWTGSVVTTLRDPEQTGAKPTTSTESFEIARRDGRLMWLGKDPMTTNYVENPLVLSPAASGAFVDESDPDAQVVTYTVTGDRLTVETDIKGRYGGESVGTFGRGR